MKESRQSVVCRLCGREFRAVNFSHLRRTHRLQSPNPVALYRRRFKLRWAASAATREKIRQNVIGRHERDGRRWTRDRIVAVICSLGREGHPLSPAKLKPGHLDLYQAARRLMGGWKIALREAGLEASAHFVRQPALDKTGLLRAIKKAFRMGRLARGLRGRGEVRRLIWTAFRLFGSWRQALTEAGVPAAHRLPVRWSRREVARHVRLRLSGGRSILAKDVQTDERVLYNAAVRIFRKPWPEVMEGLGQAYAGRRVWTPEKVIREIRRLRRSGMPVNRAAVEHGYDASLVHVAVRRFGCWDGALRAAGLNPASVRRGFAYFKGGI